MPPNFSGLSNQSGHNVNGQPYVKAISITSTPALSPDTYGRDEIIQGSVNFDQNVTAGDDAHAVLRIGTETNESRASYVSGNGTDTLVFEYTVRSEDSDDNGVDAHVPAGQDIRATGTEIAYQHNPGGVIPTMGDNPDHKLEGSRSIPDETAPTVSSISITSDPGDDDTYGLGDAIEVKVLFSEDVTVTGAPQLELDFDGTARTSDYSGSSGAAVVFSYTVALDESDTDGIAIGADKLTLNGGAIQDEAENDATLTHDAVAEDSGHKVDGSDTTAPTISSLSFTSDPGSDKTYGTGDTIQVTVTFSENVTVTGSPQMELSMSNSSNRQASYSSGAEEASGAKNGRGGLLVLLDLVAPGDTLVVTHIDRLSRGLTYGLQVIEGLHHAGVEFRALAEDFDTATSTGKIQLQMVLAFSEWWRNSIRERSVAGQAKARTEGRYPGRRPSLSEQQREYIREERLRGVSQRELAKRLEVSRWTIQQVDE